jgi:hypothetical protein
MYGGAFNQINVCPKIFHHSVWSSFLYMTVLLLLIRNCLADGSTISAGIYCLIDGIFFSVFSGSWIGVSISGS